MKRENGHEEKIHYAVNGWTGKEGLSILCSPPLYLLSSCPASESTFTKTQLCWLAEYTQMARKEHSYLLFSLPSLSVSSKSSGHWRALSPAWDSQLTLSHSLSLPLRPSPHPTASVSEGICWPPPPDPHSLPGPSGLTDPSPSRGQFVLASHPWISTSYLFFFPIKHEKVYIISTKCMFLL